MMCCSYAAHFVTSLVKEPSINLYNYSQMWSRMRHTGLKQRLRPEKHTLLLN